jgi:hypothetical protein
MDVRPVCDVAVSWLPLSHDIECLDCRSPAGETILRTTSPPMNAHGLTDQRLSRLYRASASMRRSGQQPLWGGSWSPDLCGHSLEASQLAVLLMLSRDRGLIANLSFIDGDAYLGRTTYNVCGSAFDLMSLGMAADHQVGSLPGQRFGRLAVRCCFTTIDHRQPPASNLRGETC